MQENIRSYGLIVRKKTILVCNEKINNLPILDNDTNNVVEFNDSFDDEINNNKKRNFWDLFKKDEN